MLFKINLHFHTSEDPEHNIDYTIYQGIDYAKKLGFDVLALTCHKKFVYQEKMGLYAQKQGILLIPGIEAKIEKRHVVVLNCDKKIEQIRTFNQLRDYKKTNQKIFILAPHPFFPRLYCLRKKLIKNMDVFDAIEYNWYWHKYIDFNKKAKKTAQKYNKPYVATSDTHFLSYLNKSYCLIDAETIEIDSIFKAIKQKKYKNKSFSLTWWEVLKTRYQYIFKL